MKWVTSRRTFSNWICDVIVEKTISWNHLCRKTRSQFHQQFMSSFIVRKCLFADFLSLQLLFVMFSKYWCKRQGFNFTNNLRPSFCSFCSFCHKLQIQTLSTEKLNKTLLCKKAAHKIYANFLLPKKLHLRSCS